VSRQRPLDLPTGELTAAIGMIHQRVGFATASDHDESAYHCRVHRLADHALGQQIDDGGSMELAFLSPSKGKSAIHLWSGAARGQSWSSPLAAMAATSRSPGSRQSTPRGTGFESLRSHQSLDPMSRQECLPPED
jgi:hypothetical protein